MNVGLKACHFYSGHLSFFIRQGLACPAGACLPPIMTTSWGSRSATDASSGSSERLWRGRAFHAGQGGQLNPHRFCQPGDLPSLSPVLQFFMMIKERG
jgi:hypothetical protein